jgi:hypothetical protein
MEPRAFASDATSDRASRFAPEPREALMRICWLLLLVACQRNPSKLDDNHFAPTSIAEAPDQISGTVVETIPASTYTYVRLDRDGRELWLAGPETPIAVGAKLGPLQGTLMPQFHSDTLNRTFPEINFVNSFGQPVPASHHAAPLAGTVVETMDVGRYTYAQIADAAGTKTWLAGPKTKLAIGNKLGGTSGSLMTGFRSSTLNRTFDQIYFVNGWGI